MLNSYFRNHRRYYWRSHGFTQLEILIIVFIIGLLATISIPSLTGVLEAARAKQAAVELRGAFQETQRQSIRGNSNCFADIEIPATYDSSPFIRGNCLSADEKQFPDGITLATNVVEASPMPSGTTSKAPPITIHRAGILQRVRCFLRRRCRRNRVSPDIEEKEVSIKFGRLGAAEFEVANPSVSSSAEYTAKFISVRLNKLSAPKPCVVLSGSLGLTRVGTYHGELDPVSISTDGQCQVDHWTKQ